MLTVGVISAIEGRVTTVSLYKPKLRVQEYARRMGLSITQLKDATGLAHATVSLYWHSDTRKLTWETMHVLANALYVADPRDLIAPEPTIAYKANQKVDDDTTMSDSDSTPHQKNTRRLKKNTQTQI